MSTKVPTSLHSLLLNILLLYAFLVVSIYIVSAEISESQRINHHPPEGRGAHLSNDNFDVLGDEARPTSRIPWEAKQHIYVRNPDFNQPLLQAMDNAMNESEFRSLQECLRDHPMRHHNVNADDTFSGTTGFLLSFNDKGIERFRNHPSFTCLQPYFDRYRLSNTNGWVLNMVWAEVSGYKSEYAIQLHTDDGMYLLITLYSTDHVFELPFHTFRRCTDQLNFFLLTMHSSYIKQLLF